MAPNGRGTKAGSVNSRPLTVAGAAKAEAAGPPFLTPVELPLVTRMASTNAATVPIQQAPR